MKRCKCDVSRCHAACCGLVPIPRETIEKHLGDMQGPFDKILFINGQDIVVKQRTATCAFLTSDYKCAIYDDRPEICRIFGNRSNNPLLKCSYLRQISKAENRMIAETARRVLGK